MEIGRPAIRGCVRIKNNTDLTNLRCDFLLQLQPFSSERGFTCTKPGDVAARPRQTLNETIADWIGHHHEDNRYCACFTADRSGYRRVTRKDHIAWKLDQ